MRSERTYSTVGVDVSRSPLAKLTRCD